jgi:hypothetical protein
MMRAILLIVGELLVSYPAGAATYTYNINFGNWWDQVTGTIVTDCNNCNLTPPDILSWTFTGIYADASGFHGPQTISSTEPGAQFDVFSMPSYPFVWPFTATPTGIWWNTNWHYADGTSYQMKFDGSDPQIWPMDGLILAVVNPPVLTKVRSVRSIDPLPVATTVLLPT